MNDMGLAHCYSAAHFCFVKTNPPEACLQAGFGDGPTIVRELSAKNRQLPLKIW